MIFDILVFVLSIALLIYSSEFFTGNAARMARSLGVSTFFIGVTVVGIGTSLPEIMVTDYASYTGVSGIVLGNIIGSNITNIALVLGLAFFIRSTVITGDHMLKDSIIHLGVLVFGAIIIISGNTITRIEGVVMTAVYVIYILYTLKSHKSPTGKDEYDRFNVRMLLNTFAGLAGVLIGSKLLVDSAVVIANEIGISSTVIGLTIIALGTSLPELAVSVSAAKRGFTMLILGNIVGSNITNMLLAMGTASMISDVMVEDTQFIFFNLAYMILLSLILLLVVRKKEISRWWGAVYLGMYVFFLASTYMM